MIERLTALQMLSIAGGNGPVIPMLLLETQFRRWAWFCYILSIVLLHNRILIHILHLTYHNDLKIVILFRLATIRLCLVEVSSSVVVLEVGPGLQTTFEGSQTHLRL